MEYDWNTSETMKVYKSFPSIVAEPRLDDGKQKNLLHMAANLDQGYFLQTLMDHPSVSDYGTGEWHNRVVQLIAASMTKDYRKRIPLQSAFDTKNATSVSALLEISSKMFSQEFCISRNPAQDNDVHLSEEFPFELIEKCLDR